MGWFFRSRDYDLDVIHNKWSIGLEKKKALVKESNSKTWAVVGGGKEGTKKYLTKHRYTDVKRVRER